MKIKISLVLAIVITLFPPFAYSVESNCSSLLQKTTALEQKIIDGYLKLVFEASSELSNEDRMELLIRGSQNFSRFF